MVAEPDAARSHAWGQGGGEMASLVRAELASSQGARGGFDGACRTEAALVERRSPEQGLPGEAALVERRSPEQGLPGEVARRLRSAMAGRCMNDVGAA
ncbi:hypothetical protein Zm00014a_022368 [Zea mays]|uniref:Uncharacterized protein n=1 Tax=Zea mays TaxID=4577 RepID=A0A3L6FWK4_MAIZE|nr:hypothetical protein Zm00014a_022368 [Zea mays]